MLYAHSFIDTWDYIILDEGHIIKNPATKISKSIKTLHSRYCKKTRTNPFLNPKSAKTHTLLNPYHTNASCTRNRLLLTGTPIQNNLNELWALVDWATNGRCLSFANIIQTHICKWLINHIIVSYHIFQSFSCGSWKLETNYK